MTPAIRRAVILAMLLAGIATSAAGYGPGGQYSVPARGPITMLELAETLDRLGLPPFSVVDAACCKKCSKGKACGDSCISRDKSCSKGQGCACD